MIGLFVGLWLLLEEHSAGDTDISCRWLIGGLCTALVASNLFWAGWVKSLLRENKEETNGRITDLKDNFKTLKSSKDE